MRDADWVEFLQWCLPRMEMRWAGFRKVRRQVCKRIGRRLEKLGLRDLQAYRDLLARRPGEWQTLEGLCRVTISHFYRDRLVFDLLGWRVLPELASAVRRRGGRLRCWSAGCASGEEPYTVSILWHLGLQTLFPDVELEIVATDTDPALLARAEVGCYPESSLRSVPEVWRSSAFAAAGEEFCVQPRFRRGIILTQQDIRKELPDGDFDLILCRNLVLTYFAKSLQIRIFEKIRNLMSEGGFLVIGIHEQIPEEVSGLVRSEPNVKVYSASPG
jgi:chemotaxis protein methyltransferase CheR